MSDAHSRGRRPVLDHIAIAVPDLDAALKVWRDAVGLPHTGDDVVAEQGVTVAFLDVSADPGDRGDRAGTRGPRIELLEPLSAGTAVGRHIERRGAGIHHIALRVDDVDAAMANLVAKGHRMTSAAPGPGAHGTRVVFVHPKSTGGVLLELVEHPKDQDLPAS